VRIISGQLKGRRITAPKNLPVRPTTDLAKESLFNILNNHYYFEDISVLDLFSGTGNISYEFASRGTNRVTAVDNHFRCTKFIEQTSQALELPITAIKSDVFKFLENSKQSYTVIFADPPYDFSLDLFSKLPELVFQNSLLEENGLLILEHSKHTDLSDLKHYLYTKTYGGNAFSFFSNE